MKEARIATTVTLTEKQIKDILVKELIQDPDVSERCTAGTTVIFEWHTSKWDDKSMMCKLIFANPVEP